MHKMLYPMPLRFSDIISGDDHTQQIYYTAVIGWVFLSLLNLQFYVCTRIYYCESHKVLNKKKKCQKNKRTRPVETTCARPQCVYRARESCGSFYLYYYYYIPKYMRIRNFISRLEF